MSLSWEQGEILYTLEDFCLTEETCCRWNSSEDQFVQVGKFAKSKDKLKRKKEFADS